MRGRRRPPESDYRRQLIHVVGPKDRASARQLVMTVVGFEPLKELALRLGGPAEGNLR